MPNFDNFISDPPWYLVTIFGIILGALLGWLAKLTNFIVRKLRKPHYLEGLWHAYHLTTHNGQTDLVYQCWRIRKGFVKPLVVTQHDDVRSKATDMGEISEERGTIIASLARFDQDSSFQARLTTAFSGKVKRLFGFWIGEDFDSKVTAAPMVLSEDEVEADQIAQLLTRVSVLRETVLRVD